ncbi:MAG: arsenate reductase ArsC [Candidatus Bathyarchaeota archaeon]|nr:arsenate reductase ArsC [Candidatus Bathyarchaeota archaeon]
MKKRVLFVCTHNSARSQIAEGLMNALYHDKYKACSAGIEPTKINSYVIKAMAEIGIDISKHRAKSIEEFRAKHFDYVVTVCDEAKEACPFFPGDNLFHKGFQDPSKFKGTDNEILKKVRHVRDEIKDWIEKTFGTQK